MGKRPGTHSGITLKTIRKRIHDGTGKCDCGGRLDVLRYVCVCVLVVASTCGADDVTRRWWAGARALKPYS